MQVLGLVQFLVNCSDAFQTRNTIVVSNGRYTFYYISFIQYLLSNTIYQIPFIQYLLSNTICQISFIKYHLSNTFYQIPFIKYLLSSTFYQIMFAVKKSDLGETAIQCVPYRIRSH